MGDPSRQLLAVYELPVGLVVDADCLGAAERTAVSGINGEVFLPSADWGHRGQADADLPPDLVAPAVPGLPRLGQKLFDDLTRNNQEEIWKVSFWGGPFDWNDRTKSSALFVERMVFRFASSFYEPVADPVKALYGSIDAWFETLAAWVRVVSDQDVESGISRGSVTPRGRGLHVHIVSAATVEPPVSPQQPITVRFPAAQQPLDKPRWRYALARAGESENPPIEYAFATDARAAARMGQCRRAAVDAATSVELALNRILDDNLRGLAEPMRSAVRGERRTLGALLQLLNKSSKLPAGLNQSDIREKIVNVRNKAMHTGYTPTREEAVEAAQLALTIAAAVVPLPAGGP